MSAVGQMNITEEKGPLGFRQVLRKEDGCPDRDYEGGGWRHLPAEGPEGV